MKVLVISNNAFSETACNGKTLKSFLSRLSPSDISQFYIGTNETPDLSCCENYYRVTETDIIKSILKLSFKTRNSHHALVRSIQGSAVGQEGRLFRFLKKHSSNLSFLRLALWKTNIWDNEDLNLWVEENSPDVIFALLGNSIQVHQILQKISKRYDIPYVVYFTDDYVINDTSTNVIQRMYYKKLCRAYEETIKGSSRLYAIGKKMAIEYSRKYNRNFDCLGNCIDVERFASLAPNKIDVDKDIIISFIGGIHSNRWKSISRLGAIVSDISVKYNWKIRVQVYTMTKPDDDILNLFKSNKVEYCGSLDTNGVLEQMRKSHFLLHVESFDEQYRRYVKYSISTKISEYLASNRYVIAFGPHEVASIELLKNNNLGCCLTDKDTDIEIRNKLVEAIITYNNYDYSIQQEFVNENYNVENVSRRLMNDLNTIINNK
ncbi:MAG: hypothetical protein J6K81_06085 [Rikenellaceae bacterium]|nr:hypothetical protein [Rikenellaceae bacterium]